MAKNGLHLITPTSIASTGTGNSSSISANGSVTFSTCETLSLNGVFSADYDNYMIVMRHVGSTANDSKLMRLRSNGTDNSTANSYTYQDITAVGSTVVALRTTTNAGRIGNSGSAQRNGDVVYVYGPHLAQPTAVRNVSCFGLDGATIVDFAFTHNQSTSYDGFSVYPAAGNFSGLVAVYGMRK